MKMPWREKTELAKAATIFGCLLGVSTGLCGANALVLSATMNHSIGGFFIFTAYLELAGMLIGAAGLMVVMLIWIVRELLATFRS